jgi:hypothetical protein
MFNLLQPGLEAIYSNNFVILSIRSPGGYRFFLISIPSFLCARCSFTSIDSHSYIDQVKLLAVDKLGHTRELRLIGAVHSEYGNVLPQLLFSDDVRTNTLPYETIDLKFLVPIWQSEVGEFIFVIEGYNMK